jgi:hypothetical protein
MRPLARSLAALLVPASTLLASAHQEARHVVVRGTQVLLAPPTGFAPARRYSGFGSNETGASILVIELPGPYAEVAKGMTEQRLRCSTSFRTNRTFRDEFRHTGANPRRCDRPRGFSARVHVALPLLQHGQAPTNPGRRA